jgi:hypothetical protein
VGSGGTKGSGGMNGPGGQTGTGGASPSGGAGGAGGTLATDGSTSSGGQSGSGGAPNSRDGGTVSSGGSSNVGGTTSAGGQADAGGSTAGGAGGRDAGPSTGSGGTGTGGSVTGGSGGSGGSTDVCPKPQAQACYYVSPSGSDTNDGSVTAPFLTIGKARDAVSTVNANMTGDIYVYLRGGDYRITSPITFAVKDSGTATHRIYYQAYPGETPVINGATKVTGWTASSGGVYKATLARTTKLRNLYVNDTRANMTSKVVSAKGANGTYSVTKGQADWAWASGSGFDGVEYSSSDVPAITSNKDDLEIVNQSTWNENIVCTRDVVTASDGNRALMLQQPYGAIAQLPGWGAAFVATGSHEIFNVQAWLTSPGHFYFDKTAGTLYYYPRSGEDMSTADVEAPVTEQLLVIGGTSNTSRIKNLTFQGITFANTDYNLYKVASSYGKSSVQGDTVYIAYGTGNYHDWQYEIIDTLPAIINVNGADSIDIVGNVVKHSGDDGISMINDVINSNIIGNYVTDIAGSGITIGHPTHVYLTSNGPHEKYSAGVKGICTKITVSDNLVYNVATLRGFGGHAGVTAFFTDTLTFTHNHIHTCAYNGINLGWGWRNFNGDSSSEFPGNPSNTAKNNTCSNNRFTNMMTRLHDSGAVYTIGQNPGTVINQNYVKGIPNNSSGPTYGLHNDEGSAYITENDNVLDIDKNVTYTINCEDYGAKHDLTILRTYATVNKMGANPPTSTIDTPIVVADAVWPVQQYGYAAASGVEDAYRSIVPSSLVSTPDFVFPASCAAPKGTTTLAIRSGGDSTSTVWFAPAGTTTFAEGATMTKAAGNATSIAVPTTTGSYKLSVVDSQGKKLGESAALLRVGS